MNSPIILPYRSNEFFIGLAIDLQQALLEHLLVAIVTIDILAAIIPNQIRLGKACLQIGRVCLAHTGVSR